MTPTLSVQDRLVALLQEHQATYRLVDHPAEGRTEIISQLRGNELRQAAKAIVVTVKQGKKGRRYFLCVVPGDRRLNLDAVKQLGRGDHVLFTPSELATELTGCVSGAIPPISFHADLQLVVDPELLENQEIVFNAACLEQSIFVDSASYARAAAPLLAPIALPAGS